MLGPSTFQCSGACSTARAKGARTVSMAIIPAAATSESVSVDLPASTGRRLSTAPLAGPRVCLAPPDKDMQ